MEHVEHMEHVAPASRPVAVVDRLWRAYAPFQRGRNTFGDLTSMLAILMLAGFVETWGGPEDDFAKWWGRGVAEARIGISPLMDIRAAMKSASMHTRFPLPDIRNLDLGLLDAGEPDDVPWAAAFLTALNEHPTPAEAGLPEVCELLLERHVQGGTYSAGEFHTPRSVARLMVEFAPPQPGDRILDPACGSGGLLAVAAQQIARAGHVDGAFFEAYATDRSNPPLAMMNLAVHGVDQPVVRASDPVSLFQRPGRSHGSADLVVSNPPFNQRMENIDSIGWPFGPPPESSANFAWLQLAWTRLSEKGLAAMIMPPGAAWAGGREAEIRKAMIANDALLAIIALPPNLFADTSTRVHIWLLAHDKFLHLPVGDANDVLFIDASRLGRQTPRQPRVLADEDTERIISRFREWLRSPRTTPDEPGFSRSVPHEEIVENDGSLDPRLYIDVEQEQRTPTPGVNHMLDELDRHDQAISSSTTGLRRSFRMCERLTRGDIEPRRVPLRSVVDGTVEGTPGASAQTLLLAGPSGSLVRAEDYVDAGGVPVVMPKDLTGNGFSTENIRCITEQHAERLERFRLRRGDVVLARRGELGRCAVVREEQQGWLCGTGCFMLRPPAELDADYFAAYLRSPEARKWLDAHSTGSMTMKTISLNALRDLPVVLPDLGAQQAIAGAMTRLDEHERLLREQLALTQRIRGDALNGILSN